MKDAHSLLATLQSSIDDGQLAGAAALVWRGGRVRHVACVGWRDKDAELPVERDTLFRIASMSKPVTSALALMLVEDGRFALDEPIVRWAPEFSQMRVLRSPGGPLDETTPAERQITFGDLLTHRSGLTYGPFHESALADAYDKALGGHIDSHVAPGDWIAGLAALPLIDQPGAAFHYGHSTDLLGLLLERIEGEPLGDIFERRIFGPLGMRDTYFTVPREKHDRLARAYGFDEAGRLIARLDGPGGSFLPERPQGMAYVSGGAGPLVDVGRLSRLCADVREQWRRGWRTAITTGDAGSHDREPHDRTTARYGRNWGNAAICSRAWIRPGCRRGCGAGSDD